LSIQNQLEELIPLKTNRSREE